MNVRRRHAPGRGWAWVRLISCFCLLLGLVGLQALVEVGAQNVGKLRRDAQKFVRDGNYEKAEEIYRKLLDHNPGDQQARLELSFILIKRGRLDEAYHQAVLVAGQDPLNARAHALLGTALLRSGIFQRSVEEFTTAMLLDRREALALAGLAEIDFFENRTAQAYDKLRQATFLDPREPDYWIAFGRTAARLERFKEAAEHYERFLAVSPKLDEEKRDRYRGLIGFYYALARSNITNLHRLEGPKTVTMPFELQNSRPFVEAKLNGSSPLRFVVDTGASITVLSQRAADQLSIRPMAYGGRARAVGGGGTFPIVYGLVNVLELADMRIYNVPIYIRAFHPYSPPGHDSHLSPDGFLGLSVLSNFRLTLDYSRREFILEQPTGPVLLEGLPAELTLVPFRTTNGGLISAEVRLGGDDRYNFLVDSGASTTVLAEGIVKKMNWQDRLLPDLKVRVLGAAGVIEEVDMMLLPSLTLQDLEQRNLRAPVLDMGAVNETAGFLQSGILGGSFLKHFRVTFDFQQFRLLLLPQTEAVRKITPERAPPPQDKQSED